MPRHTAAEVETQEVLVDVEEPEATAQEALSPSDTAPDAPQAFTVTDSAEAEESTPTPEVADLNEPVADATAVTDESTPAPARKRPPRERRPLQVDEVRHVGSTIKVRRGTIWHNVVPMGVGPRFEQRGEQAFLLGQYRLVRTSAPRTREGTIEGEGDLPPEAISHPGVFLRRARARHLVVKAAPFSVSTHRVSDDGPAEPSLVFSIGDYKGVLPLRYADITAPDTAKAARVLRDFIGHPVVFVVKHVDDNARIAVLSRAEARQQLARNPVEAGTRVRMIARSVFPERVIGDIGFGRDAHLMIQEWDGLWHEDMTKLVQPGEAFDVEVRSIYRTPYTETYIVSRAVVVGDQWTVRTEKYQPGPNNYYLGVVESFTRDGASFHVRLEEGVSAACSAPLHLYAQLTTGTKVLMRITQRSLEKKSLFGFITEVR